MIQKIKHILMGESRRRKYKQFLCLTKPSEDSKLLDVGAADKEYSPFDNYLEKKYPHPHQITALSILPLKEFTKKYPEIKVITYHGGKFPFKDMEFSISCSNAVIEHVGGFENQLFFIKELMRVGKQFFFTTPAKEFPLEMHTNYPFIHWLPKRHFDRIVTKLGKKWATGNYMNLLSKKDLRSLLKEACAKEFKILTHRLGPFPLHYAVWGRQED